MIKAARLPHSFNCVRHNVGARRLRGFFTLAVGTTALPVNRPLLGARRMRGFFILAVGAITLPVNRPLLGAAIVYNPNAATQGNAFSQVHNLHKLSLSSAGQYTIPVFPPAC